MFKNVAHFFATFLKKVLVVDKAVLASKPVVEAVTAAIPVFGPLALKYEDLGYAAFGELASVLTAGGDAVKAKLLDAGLDIKVIQTVEEVLAKHSTVTALASAEIPAPPSAKVSVNV